MNKAVLISIHPKWCELIASGKKTIEVRKTRPKLETPFKCYIYCTQGTFDITLCQDLNAESVKKVSEGRGKVIGSFVCDRIDEYNTNFLDGEDKLMMATCLDDAEIMDYVGYLDKEFYLWHISDLKIYDKPKELGEFRKPCPVERCYDCRYWEYFLDHSDGYCTAYLHTQITRPPQSWQFIEELYELNFVKINSK